jgi:ferredoxin
MAKLIQEKKKLPSEKKATLGGRIASGIFNSVYYPIFVTAKGYYTTEACTGCGKCVKLCPLNNIEMSGKRPRWGKNCTQCMACICRCPQEAIEYKNKTQGKRRYANPGYLQ